MSQPVSQAALSGFGSKWTAYEKYGLLLLDPQRQLRQERRQAVEEHLHHPGRAFVHRQVDRQLVEAIERPRIDRGACARGRWPQLAQVRDLGAGPLGGAIGLLLAHRPIRPSPGSSVAFSRSKILAAPT